jgi:Tol biopolymer transport system component/DNA-binding winged helix-turn-helix (wHTH) protein
MEPKRFYEFGPFRINTADRLLLRGNEVVPLTPKAYETLLALVESRGRVLEKEALMKTLWPNTFVEEGSLSQNVSLLRRALGESEGGQAYIQTIPRRGYRFAADIQEIPQELADLAAEAHSGSIIEDSAPRGRRRLLGWTAGALVILACLVVAWLVIRLRPTPAAAPPLANAKLIPITSDPGYEGEPTFSPDGEILAYVSDRTGNFEIFLKHVSGGPEINITNDPADDVQPAFSPDGNQIAFVSSRAGSPELLFHAVDLPLMGGGIYVMAALGGNARRIVESGNFPSWSPDGSGILYSTGPWFQQKIYEVSSSGGEPREITVHFKPGETIPSHLLYPSFSTDGAWIVFEGNPNTIYVVRAGGGEALTIAKGNRPVWDAGSTRVIYSSAEEGRNRSLWRVPFSRETGRVNGPAEPMTLGRGNDTQAAVSRDGKRVAFAAVDKSFNLEVLSFDAETGRASGMPRPITSGRHAIYFHNFSPDGRSVVFDDRLAASQHLWRSDLGATPFPLTTDPAFDDGYPRWSPDGAAIAFPRKPAGKPQATSSLWIMSSDGANPGLLAERAGNLAWLPDGRSLVYFSLADRQLYLLDVATKQTHRLTNEPNVMPVLAVSPDGEWTVYQSTTGGNVNLRAAPIRGGPSRPVVSTPHQSYHPFFSPSGRWLYFFLDHRNLYRVPGPVQHWRPAKPEKVTNFPEPGLLMEDPQTSHDGRQLLYSKGRITADIWMMVLGQR